MREIYKVSASQIVVSDMHPEGMFSDVPNYPVNFDSRSYNVTTENPNGDTEIALLSAQAEYSAEIVRLATAGNPNRVGWAVYIVRASDGKMVALKSWGGFPDMTPVPEQEEPEPILEPEPGE